MRQREAANGARTEISRPQKYIAEPLYSGFFATMNTVILFSARHS